MQKNKTPSKATPSRPVEAPMPSTPMTSKAKVAPTPSTPVTSKAKVAGGMGKGKTITPIETIKSRRGKSDMAGLQFGVARVHRFMKQNRYCDRIGGGAPVTMAAALQYICSELIELAGGIAIDDKKQRIQPRHIMLAIRNDLELNKLVGGNNADFMNTGRAPNIAKEILGKGKKGKGKKADPASDNEEMQDA